MGGGPDDGPPLNFPRLLIFQVDLESTLDLDLIAYTPPDFKVKIFGWLARME